MIWSIAVVVNKLTVWHFFEERGIYFYEDRKKNYYIMYDVLLLFFYNIIENLSQINV